MEIKQGHNQSFICQYHYEGKYDVEVTDKVYTIEGNHLKELKPEKNGSMEFIMEGNFHFSMQ